MNQKKLTTEQKEFRRKWVVLFSALESVLESALKFGAALYTGSAGLLADSIHSAADVAGSLMVWVGVRLAPLKFKHFPFGFYKIENLLALTIGFAILYGAYEVLRVVFLGAVSVPKNIPVGIGIVLIGMVMDFFWGRFEVQSGRLINSPGVEASGQHTLSDVFSSAVVLIGLVGSYFGFNLDRWAALFVAIIITKVGLTIIWDNLKVLLDISLAPEKIASISRLLAKQPGITQVKAVTGRNSGSFMFLHLDIGVKFYDIQQANKIVAYLKETLKRDDPSIDMIFVQHAHELPSILTIFIPTEEDGRRVSPHFGKSSQLTKITYNQGDRTCTNVCTKPNPFRHEGKQRGIKLAEYIYEQKAVSVCCREDLTGKGPGLRLHQLGVDVRHADTEDLEELLKDYVQKSTALFGKQTPSAKKTKFCETE